MVFRILGALSLEFGIVVLIFGISNHGGPGEAGSDGPVSSHALDVPSRAR